MGIRLLPKKDPVPATLPQLPPQIQEIQKAVAAVPVQPKVVWKIVYQLPMEPVRIRTLEDGTIENYMTVEEYMSEDANARIQ